MVLSILLTALAFAGDPHVETHLHHVVSTLRAETPSTLSPERRAARLELLDLLQDYAHAGEYPVHDVSLPGHPRTKSPPRAFEGPGMRAPVFVDADGTHCAVGYLMAVTDPALVDRIVATENDAYVLEMHTEGIANWAAAFGFTPDELAWIQPTYANYPIQTCTDVRVRTYEPSDTHYDLANLDFYGETCHTCGGPLSVYVYVRNEGAIASRPMPLDIQLGASRVYNHPPADEIIGTTTLEPVPPGHMVHVGVYEVEGSLNRIYNDNLDVYAVATEGTPFQEGGRAWQTVWEPERAWQQLLYPLECDEVRDPPAPPPLDNPQPGDDDEPSNDRGNDDDDNEQPPPRSCSTTSTPAGGLMVLVGLGLLGRRRRT